MITILKSGLLTSVQDLGRYGFQKYGVVVGGAMDQTAHRIANLLVGNEEPEATLEITLIGPSIHFEEDAVVAICGGDLAPTINGIPVRMWRAVYVRKGSRLNFGHVKTGCRAYLAVAGSFDIPTVMNSKSTYIGAGIGGFRGRALQKGDQLSFGKRSDQLDKLAKSNLASQFIECNWSVSDIVYPLLDDNPVIRVIKGQQFNLFTSESQSEFFIETYSVTVESNRMGYRLQGTFGALQLKQQGEMISEVVNFGSIQVPPDGNPIALLADRQTVGGYPKIGQVATVDLGRLAQAKPGDTLQFVEISHDDAQILYLQRETQLIELKKAIQLKLKE